MYDISMYYYYYRVNDELIFYLGSLYEHCI